MGRGGHPHTLLPWTGIGTLLVDPGPPWRLAVRALPPSCALPAAALVLPRRGQGLLLVQGGASVRCALPRFLAKLLRLQHLGCLPQRASPSGDPSAAQLGPRMGLVRRLAPARCRPRLPRRAGGRRAPG